MTSCTLESGATIPLVNKGPANRLLAVGVLVSEISSVSPRQTLARNFVGRPAVTRIIFRRASPYVTEARTENNRFTIPLLTSGL